MIKVEIPGVGKGLTGKNHYALRLVTMLVEYLLRSKYHLVLVIRVSINYNVDVC